MRGSNGADSFGSGDDYAQGGDDGPGPCGDTEFAYFSAGPAPWKTRGNPILREHRVLVRLPR